MVTIEKTKFDKFLEALAQQYDVYAPVTDGSTSSFERITAFDGIATDIVNTRKSPKELFFPQSEILFESDSGNITMPEKPDKPLAVWGTRPCDASSFSMLNNVFGSAIQKPGDENFEDSYWKEKYDTSLVFVTACNEPASTCFCHWFGSGPFSDTHGDVFVVDNGDAYLMNPVSEKGAAFIESIDSVKASAAEKKQIESLKSSAEKNLGVSADLSSFNLKLASIWEDRLWDELSAKCINCAACTYVCPTCHCFDVQDEQKGDHVKRMRLWDSCMYPIFTKEASGHNPRGSSKERVRQRVMHKFNYFVEKYDQYLCTGCGRCVQVCPVNFDIRDVIQRIISN